MLPPEVLQLIKDEARTLGNEMVLMSLVTLLCAEDETLAESMADDLEKIPRQEITRRA